MKNVLKKKLKVSMFSIFLLAIFLLSSCRKNYPITAYDTDLKNQKRESIVKKFDESVAAENKNIDKDSGNVESEETLNVTNYDIDDAYLSYEQIVRDKVNVSASSFPAHQLFKNVPDFNLKEYTAKTFENYSDLDSLGRVGVATAMLGKETMPEGVRESIGMIKPSGWHTVKYDNIDGNYLYNRCHLIGWQLSAENANEKNLFTGTRYLNVEGMLPYENQVAEYIKSTGNHVLYRVTPYFMGNNLVASHVQIEAMSFEDEGKGIKFNVKLENIQPGIHINYANGDSFVESIVASASQAN